MRLVPRFGIGVCVVGHPWAGPRTSATDSEGSPAWPIRIDLVQLENDVLEPEKKYQAERNRRRMTAANMSIANIHLFFHRLEAGESLLVESFLYSLFRRLVFTVCQCDPPIEFIRRYAELF